jgi:uncharacterized DUF497 family protein
MEFEWDEHKRQTNLTKHNIDFVDIQAIFDGRPIATTTSNYSDELRYLTTGEIDGTFYTVVWTWRGSNIRLISARRAHDAERRNYRSVHSRRT